MAHLKKLDPLIILIIAAVLLAIAAPARGEFAEIFSLLTKLAIAVLFFLYGARLSPQEAIAGIKNWKLHLTILSFTFVLYPLVGIALRPLSGFINPKLYLGVLFLTLVPSTVQSSVAFTSIAKGNVGGAIVSASASNLAGVVLTPLLVALLIQAGNTGVQVDGSVFAQIALQLLAPFIVGQLARPWIRGFAASQGTKIVDRGSIAMVVYSAFSGGMVAGVWSTVNTWEFLFLVVLSLTLVTGMLWLSRTLSSRLGFSRADRIAIEFCGSKKSLATGLPMAAVLFGSGTSALGLLILPLMIYHQTQLIVCSALASRYARAEAA